MTQTRGKTVRLSVFTALIQNNTGNPSDYSKARKNPTNWNGKIKYLYLPSA